MYLPQQPVTLETEHGFLVKTGNDDVCQLGTADDTSEIVFHKVLRMNSNAITNLPIPTLPHEAASKLYVDGNARKVLNGHIYLPYVHKGVVTTLRQGLSLVRILN